MMQWIRKHNIGTKLLAFLGAATMWFFVVSASDENQDRTFSNLPVELRGIETLLDKGYVILESSASTANVTLSGPVKKMSAVVADIDLLKVWVDLGSPAPGDYRYKLNALVDLDDSGLSVIERRPQEILISIDRMVDKAVPVELNLTGSPASSFRIDSRDLYPTMVTLSGPETYLSEIKSAVVTHDVTGMKDSDSVNLTFELIKEDGSPVEQSKLIWIKADVASVELSLDVRRDSAVNLRVTFAGMPDYLNEDAIDHFIDPGSITVTGEPGVIESLNYIDLGEINIKYLIDNGLESVEKKITLPNGVSSSMNGKTAVVYITFPGYERKVMSFSADSLPMLEGIEYPEQQLDITLFGMTDDLALVRREDFTLAPVVNIAELEPGVHTVPVLVTCTADSVAVLGKYSVEITVLDPVETSEPEPPDGGEGQ